MTAQQELAIVTQDSGLRRGDLSYGDWCRFWNNVLRQWPYECWPYCGTVHVKGYGVLKVSGKNLKAHRVAYAGQHGFVPAGKVVCHRCDNRCCCNPDHLFLGTQTDNVRDMDEKGRRSPPIGELNGSAILTQDSVREIRNLHVAGNGIRALARQFGTTPATIRNVVRRRTWRHVP